MTLIEAVKHVFQNYANFNGRARRSEYWYFRLFDLMVPVIISIVTLLPGLLAVDPLMLGIYGLGKVLLVIYALASIVPSLAVTCRRLHDIGKPGSYMFFFLLPIVGTILIMVWAFQDGDPGENRYGKNPKNRSNVAPTDKTCPHCGAVIKAGAKYCGKCGKSILPTDSPGTWACDCGKENPATSSFCSACGKRRGGTAPEFGYCVKCGKRIPVGARLCAECMNSPEPPSGGFKTPTHLG